MNTGLIHYNSSLQQIVALSTAKSELYGLVMLATALLWLRTIMFEIGYDQGPSFWKTALQQFLSAKVRSRPQVE